LTTTLSILTGGVYGRSIYGEAIFGVANVDFTSYLLHDSITVKVNALDFALHNPPIGSPALGAPVTLTNPAWAGTVVSTMSSDPVDLSNGIQWVSVTATNTNALLPDTAPFDLSDVPTTTPLGVYQAEDGSTFELEDGTDFAPGNYELEGALSYGYSGLSVRTSVNSDPLGPPQTLGTVTVYQPGLRPGNIFKLTSLNQGYTESPFEITQVTITWPGLAANPFYAIEFGDTPQTLAAWTATHAAPVVADPPVTPPATPASTIVYGLCRASAGTLAQGGGIVTIASATFSFPGPAAGTCQVVGAVDARMVAWDNYVAKPRRAVRAVLSGGVYTGAWNGPGAADEYPFGLTRAITDVSSGTGLAIAAGTYTVSLQVDTTATNQMQIFSGYVEVLISA